MCSVRDTFMGVLNAKSVSAAGLQASPACEVTLPWRATGATDGASGGRALAAAPCAMGTGDSARRGCGEALLARRRRSELNSNASTHSALLSPATIASAAATASSSSDDAFSSA